MVALTLELAGVVSSIVTAPEGCWNMPRTLENTCLQTNPTDEFSGSRAHFDTAGTAGAGAAGEPGAGEAAAAAAAGLVAAGRGSAAFGELQAGMNRRAIAASTAWRIEGLPRDLMVRGEPERDRAIFTRLRDAVESGRGRCILRDEVEEIT